MRSKTIFLTLFCAAALAVSFVMPAAANPLKQLLQEETRGLKSITEQRMKTFMTEPTQKPAAKIFSLRWLDSQPEATGGKQWRCLSEALYFEARGETVKGQFAVAEVIMNRVESERFPESTCGVINQGTGRKYQCQFTYTCDGLKETIAEPRAMERVKKVARMVLDGRAPELTDGAMHYHTKAVRPSWSKVYTRTAAIGTHIFYRHTWRTASN